MTVYYLLGQRRERDGSLRREWRDLYTFDSEEQRLGFLIKEAIKEEEESEYTITNEETLLKEYGVEKITKVNYEVAVFKRPMYDEDFTPYLAHKEEYLEWKETDNDWQERKQTEFKEFQQAEGKDKFFVLQIKTYQEGASSGYSWVTLYKLHIFNDKNNLKGFMVECDMYGNDEYDSGNTFKEVTYEELLNEFDAEIFDDLRSEFSLKIYDRTEYDYSEYIDGGLLEDYDDDEE